MKQLLTKYKFPLKVVKSGTTYKNLPDESGIQFSSDTEDDNHILDQDNIEVLGTSEWLRFDNQDAEDIVDILNDYWKNTIN